MTLLLMLLIGLRVTGMAEMALAAIAWTAIFGLMTAPDAPASSYLFAWPTILCSLGLMSFAKRAYHGQTVRLAVATNLAALVLLGPTLGLLCRLMSKEPAVSQLIGAIGVGLGALVLVPSVAWIDATRRGPRAIAWILAFALLFAFSWLRASGV